MLKKYAHLIVFVLSAAIGCWAAGPNYEVAYSTGPNQSGIIYYVDQSGNEFVAGNITSSGTATNTFYGKVAFQSTPTVNSMLVLGATSATISVSTQILPTSSYMNLLTTGPILMASLPTISTATTVGGSTAWADGTMLVLTSTSATNATTLQDNATLAGSRLMLGNYPTRVVSSTNTLTFIFNASSVTWNCTNCSK
jgi:hypothetical protein